jgi:hypothetical protein
MNAPRETDDVSLWEIATNLRTGAAGEEPRRITDWREGGDWHITSSAVGKRVVPRTATGQCDVYIADFDLKTPY